MSASKLRMPIVVALAAAIIAALAIGTNWRLALVAALAAGAIMLTRLRYAEIAALVLLVIVLALAETGHSGGSDHRDAQPRTSHR